MSKRKKPEEMSKAELLVEVTRVRARNRGQALFEMMRQVGGVIREAIRWGAMVLMTYFLYRATECLAGKTTLASIGWKFMADVKVSVAIAWIFGVSGVLYGLAQLRLRRKVVQQLSGRLSTYQRELDPKRSSSLLTSRGETREEDKES